MVQSNKSGQMLDDVTREQAESAVRTLIEWAGDDPDREGMWPISPIAYVHWVNLVPYPAGTIDHGYPGPREHHCLQVS